MNAGRALTNLDWVEGKLKDEYTRLDLGELPALRLYASIQQWKIDKVLPSLKAIEHSGQMDGVLQVEIVRFTSTK